MTRMNRMMTLALMAFALVLAGVGAIGTLRAAPAPAKDAVPTEKELDKRIDQLQSEDAKEREKISEELVKLGKSALPALKAALKRNDAAFRSRVEKVIAKIEGPTPMPAVGTGTIVVPANIEFKIQLAPGAKIIPGQAIPIQIVPNPAAPMPVPGGVIEIQIEGFQIQLEKTEAPAAKPAKDTKDTKEAKPTDAPKKP